MDTTIDTVAGFTPANVAACDVCGCPSSVLCTDRQLVLCEHCLRPGRLSGLDHRMPRGEIICVHRRKDSLAVKMGAGASVLYQTEAR